MILAKKSGGEGAKKVGIKSFETISCATMP